MTTLGALEKSIDYWHEILTGDADHAGGSDDDPLCQAMYRVGLRPTAFRNGDYDCAKCPMHVHSQQPCMEFGSPYVAWDAHCNESHNGKRRNLCPECGRLIQAVIDDMERVKRILEHQESRQGELFE